MPTITYMSRHSTPALPAVYEVELVQISTHLSQNQLRPAYVPFVEDIEKRSNNAGMTPPIYFRDLQSFCASLRVCCALACVLKSVRFVQKNITHITQ